MPLPTLDSKENFFSLFSFWNAEIQIKFVILHLHLPVAAVIISEESGKLRVSECRRKISFCMPNGSRFDQRSTNWRSTTY